MDNAIGISVTAEARRRIDARIMKDVVLLRMIEISQLWVGDGDRRLLSGDRVTCASNSATSAGVRVKGESARNINPASILDSLVVYQSPSSLLSPVHNFPSPHRRVEEPSRHIITVMVSSLPALKASYSHSDQT